MPLDFPPSPAVNEIYTFGGRYWIWNGTAWDSYSPVTTITTLNGLTGTVGITAGSGMGVTVSGQNIVLNNTGVLSFNGLTGAVTGVTTGNANTFGPVQSFNGGIVASGATLTGNVYITGLSNPSIDSQAANKAYVDSVASVGIHYHTAVALASTDSETFNTGVTYDNGASGVGATLRKTASFARINIDSTDGSTGDRILIRSAATQQWNGVYSVTNQGSGSTGWILTRTTDADNYHPYENDGLGGNDYFFVTGGSSLKNNAYICSNAGGITFGTTAITFAIFSTPPVYTAGTGLALNSLQFSNTGVLSFNGSTGSITGVSSVRGLTGAVGITNGSGIGLSVSGQTMTVSNTGVLSINGGTGAVINVARTNVNNNFTTNQSIDPSLQVVDTNVTGNYITIEPSSNQITNFQDLTSATGILQFSQPTGFGYTVTIPATTTVLAGLSNTQTFTSTNTFNALTSFSSGISAAGATFTGLARFTAGISASGGITFSPRVYVDGNILTSPNGVIESGFNGWFRGLQWIDPNGGRARIVLNYSSTPRSIDFKVDGVSFDGSGELTRMQLFASGLSCSQGATFGNSINVTGNVLASGGISAAGGTFGGNIILENAEFIRNSTNGRIDLMPAPAGSTHYGLSIDTTSWGFGPRLGTIRSSDNALNTAAILWDVPPTLANNVRFNFGSNGQNGVVLSDTGNDTIQLFTNVTSGINSGAIAIVDAAGINAANRAPGTTHANPNLYIYRAGNARATDFIRFEHDGNTGYMITGGTTDIELMPGSGIVGVSGNIQVLQNQIYVTNNARSWFL